MGAAPSTLTGQLAEFVLRTDYEALPDEVIHTAKRALLDLVGCAVAAAVGHDLQALVRGIKRFDRSDESCVWGTGERASIPMAVMANGTAAHARELDDCGGPGHLGAVVIPAVLGVGEASRRTGREALAAIALGYEILFRVSDGVGGSGAMREPGWHPVSVLGGIGSAAACGKLLGLKPEQLTWAMGLAGSFTGGTWAFIVDGTMSKWWHCGRAAANGVEAAFLAQEGFTGPTEVLEAPWGGLYGTHFPNARLRLDAVTTGLGTNYRMLRTWFKVHACCWGIQAYLEALLSLIRDHGLTGADVAGIELDADDLTSYRLGKRDVRTSLDAHMSVVYTLAVAAFAGKASIEQYAPRWMEDPRVRQLAANVTFATRPAPRPGETRAIRVRLRDGEMLLTQTETPVGSPFRPLSDSQLTAKFNALVAPVLGVARAHDIAGEVWRFDQVRDVADFCNLLVP